MSVPLDPRPLRTALGAFATGVTIVTTVTQDGQPIGNTANSFASVSLDPPLILWSLARDALSYGVYMDCRHFAVNVLREDQADLSVRFAKSAGDKWQGVEYRIGETGCPVLPHSLAVFECRCKFNYDGGDHAILVGEVMNFTHDPAGKPLIFWRGGYHRTVV